MPGGPAPIIGLGAGGHARSLLDALDSTGRFEVVALVDDDPALDGDSVLGIPVVAREGVLAEFRAQGVEAAFVGIGGVRSPGPRRRALARLAEAGFEVPPVVHGSASVSRWAALGRGAQVLALAVVNAGAALGPGAIANTASVVEHDCLVGAGAHVGPRAVLGGGVRIGEGAHVGMGAVVNEGVEVGEEAFVAAGAVVVAAVPANARVAGVPARPLRLRPPSRRGRPA